MSSYQLLPLLAVSVNLALVVLVLRSRYQERGNITFALFLFSMALWGGSIFLMRSSSSLERALVWDKAAIINFALLSVLYLRFTYIFRGITPKRWVFPAVYLTLGALSVLTIGGWVVESMQRKFYGYAPTLGPLFFPYILFVYGGVVVGLSNILNARREAVSHVHQTRANYLILATVCSLAAGTTDLLPVLGLTIYPLGILGNIFFAIIGAIAIVKERLVDVRVLLRTAITYLILISAVSTVYGLTMLAVARSGTVMFGPQIVALCVGLVVVLALGTHPILGWIRVNVDKGFYGSRYGSIEAMRRFSHEVKDVVDLGSVASSLVAVVNDVMRPAFVVLLQLEPQRRTLVAVSSTGSDALSNLTLSERNPLVSYITKRDHPVSARELIMLPEWQAVGAPWRDALANAAVYVPLQIRNLPTGLLIVGAKHGVSDFTQEDIDLIQTAASQAVTAMENARLLREAKRQLQELKEAQGELVRSAKLASVGTLAAGVAHEINNPVFAIKMRTELMLTDPAVQQSNRTSQDVATIEEMADRITKVIHSFLDLSRKDDPVANVSLNDVADVALDLVDHKLRLGGVEIIREYAPDLPEVKGSHNQLQQVVINILLNAKDSMVEGGSLTIATASVDGQVRLSCTDTGSGIPQETLDHIFDAFYTTKEVGKGTGLGLWVCHKIIEEHGGRIQVESEAGKGTTFTILLPLAYSENGHRSPVTPVVSGTASG